MIYSLARNKIYIDIEGILIQKNCPLMYYRSDGENYKALPTCKNPEIGFGKYTTLWVEKRKMPR